MLAAVDYQRPEKLYRYSSQSLLQKSLTAGEFRLLPAVLDATMRMQPGGKQILPFKSSRPQSAAGQHYLILSFAHAWDENLFGEFADADCCLIVHDPEQFGERIHRAVKKMLPTWAGIDAAISYGASSPLGAAFTRDRQQASQKEWLFAWRPMQSTSALQPSVIQIGSIEQIAELRVRRE